MKSPNIRRRNLLKGSVSVAALSGLPLGGLQRVLAATEEERIIAAAKKVGPAGIKGMIWSNYYSAMKRTNEAFKQAAGIGVDSIQDISVFQIPQRAMAEALSRSPQFDFFHLDSNMIPSLVSAGLLEPLDDYFEEAGYSIDAVGDYGKFMTYKGKTYGVITDGNIHTQFIRWDLVEKRKKEYEDKFGKPPAWPVTWEDDQRMMEFFQDTKAGVWGSANLRNRANGVTWWYMNFYSAGGFPFDDDMKPTLNTDAGKYALETYLKVKKVSHPEAPGWGTPQMIPRMIKGHAFACQYWDGIIALNENPKKSTTVGKWKYGLVPGSNFSGKQIHRSIASPIVALMINRYSPRKQQAAMLAMWFGTLKNSEDIVADRLNTFHDPWHKGHMTSKAVRGAYTEGGMDAIEQNLKVASPPIYLTGLLEFQDILGKNISEAYVGQMKASDVLPKTEDAWNKVVRRVGRKKLQAELAGYKSLMPKIDKPA